MGDGSTSIGGAPSGAHPSGGNAPVASPSGGSVGVGGTSAASDGGSFGVGGAGDGGSPMLATGGAPVVANPSSKNWVYIMLGQSNMAGTSPLESQDLNPPPRVFKLLPDKTWAGADEPVCVYDAELSPSRAFGIKILEKVTDPEVNIYLINAAVGGTTIESWNPQNGPNYLAMLPYLEEGIRKGSVRGFIWHQGEYNMNTPSADYVRMLAEIIAAIRTKVGDPTLPAVAGEIDQDFDFDGTPLPVGNVNRALATLATQDPLFRVSSRQGLKLNPDNPLHYDSASERLMGEKMATAWWSILGK